MLFLRLAASIVTSAYFTTAHSSTRNPLLAIGTVQDTSIDTHSHRVTALSHFDISLQAFRRRIRLSLQPNHDILPEGAEVHYLGDDGEVARIEKIDRLEHKVFKGDTWAQNVDGSFSKVGWARITVVRDGELPLLEGAFSVDRDHYHVQSSKNYAQTREPKDPHIELTGEEYMVVWRDSDIMSAQEDGTHVELKRDIHSAQTCQSDDLDFNMDLDHPVFTGLRDQDPIWGSTPIDSLFGKRQLDTGTGAGNGAGVNLVSSIGQTSGCPSMRKVALVGVATDCSYTSTFDSETTVRQNVINQLNTASDLYEKTFNISLGLANIVVSPKDCPGTAPAASPWNVPCNGNLDIQARLNVFSQWRGTKQDNYSHWTLLTNCNTGSAVGLAWLGQACVGSADSRNATRGSSSGGVQTTSGANVVARTSTEWQVIAHETGHTFGAVHDCTSLTCSDGTSTTQQCCPLSATTCNAGERYIMNPSTAQGITSFSPCSIGNICSALGRQSVKSACFSNNRGVTTITGQQCGNGIVEAGEDCDCGGTSGCTNNNCCDAKTCKFKNNAVCDDQNEECCRGCQLAAASTVCRASTGVCDPQETCTGSSPVCPPDKTQQDGSSCGNGLKCATGHCTSRDLQCKTLMGSYTSGNDTYACDHQGCTLSCGSPQFGPNVCYGLQQNFLDGTDCGGGGHCSNGQCKGSNFGKEIKSWIDDHKAIVIGICAGIGGILLLMILSCVWRRWQRKKQSKRIAAWGRGGGDRSGVDPLRGAHYQRAASRSNPSALYTVPAPGAGQSESMQQRGDASSFGNPRGPPSSSSSSPWLPPAPHMAASPPPVYRGGSVRYA